MEKRFENFCVFHFLNFGFGICVVACSEFGRNLTRCWLKKIVYWLFLVTWHFDRQKFVYPWALCALRVFFLISGYWSITWLLFTFWFLITLLFFFFLVFLHSLYRPTTIFFLFFFGNKFYYSCYLFPSTFGSSHCRCCRCRRRRRLHFADHSFDRFFRVTLNAHHLTIRHSANGKQRKQKWLRRCAPVKSSNSLSACAAKSGPIIDDIT